MAKPNYNVIYCKMCREFVSRQVGTTKCTKCGTDDPEATLVPFPTSEAAIKRDAEILMDVITEDITRKEAKKK